ncbi:magnesium transporter [Chytriomyces sp. MP71]|nr:magnesium transporter [Chytriomyces sp. MP71]
MEQPHWYKAVGITLALLSGLFIGSSFILKKRGLLDTKSIHGELGDGHNYLKSPMWWSGMILMALGEVLNFVAYAFSPAILVTPLGAISVVVSAILSSIFLDENLNLSGKIGCAQCIVGAILIVIHAPESNSSDTIPEFFGYVGSPLFLTYAVLVCGSVYYLVYRVAPVHGETNVMVYISICSLVGSFLVLSCQGFGSSVAYTFGHWEDDNQFLQWPIYPLMAVIVGTVMCQIHFLNKALNKFSTAIVTPVYYVSFTTCTLVSSAVLFRGFTVTDSTHGISLVMGFLVIVGGVALLFQSPSPKASRLNR